MSLDLLKIIFFFWIIPVYILSQVRKLFFKPVKIIELRSFNKSVKKSVLIDEKLKNVSCSVNFDNKKKNPNQRLVVKIKDRNDKQIYDFILKTNPNNNLEIWGGGISQFHMLKENLLPGEYHFEIDYEGNTKYDFLAAGSTALSDAVSKIFTFQLILITLLVPLFAIYIIYQTNF